MFYDNYIEQKPYALHRVVKLIEVPMQSPYLVFGRVVWASVIWVFLSLIVMHQRPDKHLNLSHSRYYLYVMP